MQKKEHPLGKNREEKANKVLEDRAVKVHCFVPSGREIVTVLGNEGDSLVSYAENGARSYCSCDDFYFRVQSGSVPECYHLIAVRRALQNGQYSKVSFSDEEFAPFVSALVKDIFSHIS
ncbi:MAG: hypothetical protein ACYCQJ_04215 [Nitrososphaerales archaeon]